jgi:undecaprenyl pyrophosphate synthase
VARGKGFGIWLKGREHYVLYIQQGNRRFAEKPVCKLCVKIERVMGYNASKYMLRRVLSHLGIYV